MNYFNNQTSFMEPLKVFIRKKYLHLGFSIFLAATCSAQISSPYQISSIGNSGSTELVYAGPINLNGLACFQMQTGLPIFQIPYRGLFATHCLVFFDADDFFNLSIVAFPNPVITVLTIKSYGSHEIDELADRPFIIRLYTLEGLLAKTDLAYKSQLNTGYQINLGNLKDGPYFLKIYYGNIYLKTVKIIKTH